MNLNGSDASTQSNSIPSHSASVDTASASSAYATAKARCFRVTEIIQLLSTENTPLKLSSAPPSSPPPSGALFLYDRGITRDYKKDGHEWARKRVCGSKGGVATAFHKVQENSVKLRHDGQYRVAGWYARSTSSGGMRRRAYYLINPADLKRLNDWVLVHYLDDAMTLKTPEVGRSVNSSACNPIFKAPERMERIERQCRSAKTKACCTPGHKPTPCLEQRHYLLDKAEKASEEGALRSLPNASTSKPLSRILPALSDLQKAPRITDEDLAKEWALFTEEEKRDVISDIYGSEMLMDGQMTIPPDDYTNAFMRDVKEEIESLRMGLMDEELKRTPLHEKFLYLEARQRCPELVSSSKIKSLFLRCEDFSPNAAARRLVLYWTKRVEIFGSDRAFLPLTLDGAMADDYEEFAVGFARLLPSTDASGRGVMFVDYTKSCPFTTTLRTILYLAHAALENESVRLNGLVIVVFGQPPLEHVDRKRMLARQQLLRDALPVKIRAIHKCHFRENGEWFTPVVHGVAKFTAGKHFRARMVVHEGSKAQLVCQLGEYGISMNILPATIGGAVPDSDFTKWLLLRKTMGL